MVKWQQYTIQGLSLFIFGICIVTLSISVANIYKQDCKPLIMTFYGFILTSVCITAAVMIHDFFNPNNLF